MQMTVQHPWLAISYSHSLLLLLLLLYMQVTVNNQIVIGTLMNICDDPNRVSIGANWREGDHIRRVPIIVTGMYVVCVCVVTRGALFLSSDQSAARNLGGLMQGRAVFADA